jgi:hypothetical protein
MFKRFKASPVTVSANGHNDYMNNNPYATSGPSGTATSQGGLVQGFVFTKWLRLYLVDLITMAIMGAAGLGVYRARKLVLPCIVDALADPTPAPAPSRSFPVFHTDGSIVYPEYAYPVRKEIVPIWLAAFIAFFAPLSFSFSFKSVEGASMISSLPLWVF